MSIELVECGTCELHSVGAACIDSISYCSKTAKCYVILDNEVYVCDHVHAGYKPMKVSLRGQKTGNCNVRSLDAQGGLLIFNEREVGFRRPNQRVYLLKTVLQRAVSADDDDVSVLVEITLSEAKKLHDFLNSQIKNKKATVFEESIFAHLDDELKKLTPAAVLENSNDANLPEKWESVCIRGRYVDLRFGFLRVLENLRQTNSSNAVARGPELPVVSALVERLNIMRPLPYKFELNAEGSGLNKACVASEIARSHTFTNWPHMHYKWCLPEQMAEAGFYHQPNEAGDDRALCFTCSLCLVCWEPSDEPWSEHERHSPQCPLVRMLPTENVPAAVTYASWPAYANGTEDDVSAVSTTANCNLLATSTRHGEVVLWNVEKYLQRCSSFQIDPTEPYLSMRTGYQVNPSATGGAKSSPSGRTHKVSWAEDQPSEAQMPPSPPKLTPQDNVLVDTIREVIDDMPAGEIAQEIGVVKPGKEDVVIDALCCYGQRRDLLTRRSIYKHVNVSPALFVGCGIAERKLTKRTLGADLTPMEIEMVAVPAPQQVSEARSAGSDEPSSPASSFVETLNTLNVANVAGQPEIICEAPGFPSTRATPESPSSMPMEVDAGQKDDQLALSYRPFLLVYKIEQEGAKGKPCQTRSHEQRPKRAPYMSSGSQSQYNYGSAYAIDDETESWPEPEPVDLSFFDDADSKLMDMNSTYASLAPSGQKPLDYSVDDFSAAEDSMNNNSAMVGGVVGSSDPVTIPYNEAGAITIDSLEDSCDYDSSPDFENSGVVEGPIGLSASQNPNSEGIDAEMLATINGTPEALSCIFLQVIRLPMEFDSPHYSIHSITPLLAGDYVLVVVNRVTTSGAGSSCLTLTEETPTAFLVYKVSFTGAMTGLEEKPVRICRLSGSTGSLTATPGHTAGSHAAKSLRKAVVGPRETARSLVVLPQTISPELSSDFGFVGFTTTAGNFVVLSLDSGDLVAAAPRLKSAAGVYTLCTYAPQAEQLYLATSRGHLVVLQVVGFSPVADDFSDEIGRLTDVSVTGRLERLLTILAADEDLIVNQPLTFDSLLEAWALTTTDPSSMPTNNGSGTNGAPSAGGAGKDAVKFQAEASSCWTEIFDVKQELRARKYPLKVNRNKMTRTWHLVPDETTWREHIFELTLPTSMVLSHVNARFELNSLAPAVPRIQVTLLQQHAPGTAEMSWKPSSGSGSWGERGGSSGSADASDTASSPIYNRALDKGFLSRMNACVVAGPLDLTEFVSVDGISGVIQFPCTDLVTTKSKTFFIHIQALTTEEETRRFSELLAKQAPKAPDKLTYPTESSKSSAKKAYYATKVLWNAEGWKPAAMSNPQSASAHKTLKEPQNETLKGCDWIQEVSITLNTVHRVNIPKERKQRFALVYSTKFHKALISLYLLSLPTDSTLLPQNEYAANLTLDVLIWLVSNMREAAQLKLSRPILAMVAENFSTLLRSVVFTDGRSLSQKFVVFMCGLLGLAPPGRDILRQLQDGYTASMPYLCGVRSAGSLSWYLSLGMKLFTWQSAECKEPLLNYAVAMIGTLQQLANICTRHNNPLHSVLNSNFNLWGLPMELEMFDMPPVVLVKSGKSAMPITYAGAVAQNVNQTSNIANKYATAACNWIDVLNLHAKDESKQFSSTRVSGKGFFAAFGPRALKRSFIGTQYLPGLLDVEPLLYSFHSASEGMKVENLLKGTSTLLDNSNVSPSSGPFPLPDLAEMETASANNPALSNAVNSMKQQVQSLLNKQMRIFELKQKTQQLQEAAGLSTNVSADNSESCPATQASSASTFGVPTTPKTTPAFMTPTPLSPSHLSPMNSESHLNYTDGDEPVTPVGKEVADQNEVLGMPVPYALVINSMNSGARRFVILNFGVPVLLTDVLIPNCAEVGSLSVDCWLRGESVDSQRLVTCNDISSKSLVLSDILPPVLCQFLKISFVGRHGLNSASCKVPVGCFYGYRHYLPWQTYASQPGVVEPGVLLASLNQEPSTVAVETRGKLRQLMEDLRCRYSLARRRLEVVTRQTAVGYGHPPENDEGPKLMDTYSECMQLKVHWNLVQRVYFRMCCSQIQLDSAWEQCCADKLWALTTRVVQQLCAVMTSSPDGSGKQLRLEWLATGEVSFDVHDAVNFFEKLCFNGSAFVQAYCGVWLLESCAHLPWWGQFFPEALRLLHQSQFRSHASREGVLLFLVYLAQRTIAAYHTTPLEECLKLLCPVIGEDIATRDVEFADLVVFFLSSALNAATSSSPWDFLLGEYAPKRGTLALSSSGGSTESKRKPGKNQSSVQLGFSSTVKPPFAVSASGTVPLGSMEDWDGSAPPGSSASFASVYNMAQKMLDIDSPWPAALTQFQEDGFPNPVGKLKTSSSASKHKSLLKKAGGSEKLKKASDSKHPAALGSSNSSSSSASRSSKRRSGVMLQLPHELCARAVPLLVNHLMQTCLQRPLEVVLSCCKVIMCVAKSSSSRLYLMDMFGESELYEYLVQMVACECPLLKHGMMALIVEMVHCEYKAEAHAVQTPSTSTSALAKYTASAMHSMQRNTVIQLPPSVMEVVVPQETAADIEMAKDKPPSSTPPSDKAINTAAQPQPMQIDEADALIVSTQVAAAEGDSPSSPTPNAGMPMTAEEAKVAVENAVKGLTPSTEITTKISMDVRLKQLRISASKLLHEYLNNGGSLDMMGMWLEHASRVEESFAKSSSTEEKYIEQLNSFATSQQAMRDWMKSLMSDDGSGGSSGGQSGSMKSLLKYIQSQLESIGAGSAADKMEVMFLPPGVPPPMVGSVPGGGVPKSVIVHVDAMPPVSFPPLDSGGDTADIADSSGDESSSDATTTAMEEDDALTSATPTPQLKIDEQQGGSMSNEPEIALAPAELTTATVGGEAGKQSSSVTTGGTEEAVTVSEDDVFASTSAEEPAEPQPLAAYRWIPVAKEVQHISLAADERIDNRLCWDSFNSARYAYLATQIASSSRLAQPSPLLNQIVQSSGTTGSGLRNAASTRATYDPSKYPVTSTEALKRCFEKLFEHLEHMSAHTVIDVMEAFWYISIGAHSKISSSQVTSSSGDKHVVNPGQSPKIPLTVGAVSTLVRLMTQRAPEFGADGWSLALQILVVLANQKTQYEAESPSSLPAGMAGHIVENTGLKEFLLAFLNVGNMGCRVGEAGRVIKSVFQNFVTRLQIHCCTPTRQVGRTLRQIVVEVLIDVLQRNVLLSNECPTDILNVLAQVLTTDFGCQESDIVLSYFRAVTQVTNRYMDACKAGSGRAVLTGGGQGLNPRLCFAATQPETNTSSLKDLQAQATWQETFLISCLKLAAKIARSRVVASDASAPRPAVLVDASAAAVIMPPPQSAQRWGDQVVADSCVMMSLFNALVIASGPSWDLGTIGFPSNWSDAVAVVVTPADAVVLLATVLVDNAKSQPFVEMLISYIKREYVWQMRRRMSSPLLHIALKAIGDETGLRAFVEQGGIPLIVNLFIRSCQDEVPSLANHWSLLMKETAYLSSYIRGSHAGTHSNLGVGASPSRRKYGMMEGSGPVSFLHYGQSTYPVSSSVNAGGFGGGYIEPTGLPPSGGFGSSGFGGSGGSTVFGAAYGPGGAGMKREPRIEGMINFAPYGKIKSSSPMAQHLNTLLQSSPAYRRCRTAAWSYHFYQAETWLDLMITLPYPVMLHEVQLKPHSPSLQNAPSAVQLEVAADSSSAKYLKPIGPPVASAGLTKIRISTAGCKHPIQVVRLHLRRPLESMNVGISQILLLGHPMFANSDPSGSFCQSREWLRFLHGCLKTPETGRNAPVFSKGQLAEESSMEVDEKLVEKDGTGNAPHGAALSALAGQAQTFAQHLLRFTLHSLPKALDAAAPNNTTPTSSTGVQSASTEAKSTLLEKTMAMVEDLFVLVEGQLEASQRETVMVQAVLDGIVRCKPAPGDILEWLLSILWSLSLGGSDVAITEKRTSAILHWLKGFIDSQSYLLLQRGTVVSVLNCVAAILWKIPAPVLAKWASELISMTVKAALSADDPEIAVSFAHILCAIGHSDVKCVAQLLREMGIVCSALHPCQVPLSKLRLLSRVIQSPSAIAFLSGAGYIKAFTDGVNKMLTLLAQGTGSADVEWMEVLLGVFAAASTEPTGRSVFVSEQGRKFWEPLLRLLTTPSSAVMSSRSGNFTSWCRLEDAVIEFFKTCVFDEPDAQLYLANVLCALLKDEAIPFHPCFGYDRHVWLKRVSVYSTVQDLTKEQPTKPGSLTASNRLAMAKLAGMLDSMASDKVMIKAYKEWTQKFGTEQGKKTTATSTDAQSSKTASATGQPSTSAAATTPSEETPKGSKAPSPGKDIDSVASELPVWGFSYREPGSGATTSLPGSLTLGNLAKGVSVHTLRVVNLEVTRGVGATSSESECPFAKGERLPNCLEIFSDVGGLSLLAEHLHHYQPTIVTTSRPRILDDGVPAMPKPSTSAYDDDWVAVNPTDNDSWMYDLGGDFVPSRMPQPSLPSQQSHAIYPHVILSFGLFLKVSGYAGVLVREHRQQAQWLLRLALGVTTNDAGDHITSQPAVSTMSVLPFEVLGSLYRRSPWSTPDGQLIRQHSLDIGIVDVLVALLAEFSHESNRSQDVVSEGSEAQVASVIATTLRGVMAVDEMTSSVKDRPGGGGPGSSNYWAKGTGFGTGSTQTSWNMDAAYQKQKFEEENISCLLKVLSSLICPGDVFAPEMPQSLSDDVLCPRLLALISGSSVIPVIVSYLINDSVLDIARHTAVYEAVLHVLIAMALCPQLRPLFAEPSDSPIGSLLAKLKRHIDVYVSKLKPAMGAEGRSQEEASMDEGILTLVPLFQRTTDVLEAHGTQNSTLLEKDADVALDLVLENPADTSVSLDEKYCKVMKNLQFESIPFLENETEMKFRLAYHYESAAKAAGKTSPLAPRVRRLAQETLTLCTSLPLSSSSSVFVRCAEERLDLMKVLITGPLDTPYMNGCFEFDVWFPVDYPQSPMQINLQTTGGHSVRFNPNLYNDGKVCLSILNTWHGRPEERWNQQTSSFLQVLVSIQSLILVQEPYFNEPGYERSRSTPAGQAASRDYDADIRQASVRWAMLEQLRSPSSCFRNVIQKHFWLKREEILAQVSGWITEMDAQAAQASGQSSGSGASGAGGLGPSSDNARRLQRSFQSHTAALKRHFAALKEELAKMENPFTAEKRESTSSSGAAHEIVAKVVKV